MKWSEPSRRPRSQVLQELDRLPFPLTLSIGVCLGAMCGLSSRLSSLDRLWMLGAAIIWGFLASWASQPVQRHPDRQTHSEDLHHRQW